MLTTTLLEDRCLPVVSIALDYSLDTQGFFNDPARREVLNRAVELATSRLTNDLPPIVSAGGNTFDVRFDHPETDQLLNVPGLSLPADTLRIYIGARPLDSSELAIAMTGSSRATGTAGFVNGVVQRVTTGAAPTIWGGTIAFDSRPETNWHIGVDRAGLREDQIDMLSVATHEMFHILGFGLSEPWNNQIVNRKFVGANAVALQGGAVPVNRDLQHWDRSVRSGGNVTLMDPGIERGQRVVPTALDFAGLADIGWQVSPAILGIEELPLANGSRYVAYGSDAGGLPLVELLDPISGARMQQFLAADRDYRGGVRVAVTDANGDGGSDLVVTQGANALPLIRIFDDATGRLGWQWLAFEPEFRGGVLITATDEWIVATPDDGGSGRVRIFDSRSGAIVADFFGIEDTSFRGGARASLGDLNGDGVPDLVVSAGTGGGPRVAIYDGAALRANRIEKLVGDFFVFEPTLRDGVNVAFADLTSDGRAELIVGSGPSGAPRVLALDGAELIRGKFATLANFFAGDANARGGVRLAVRDVDGAGSLVLLTAPGASALGAPSQLYEVSRLAEETVPRLQLAPFGDEALRGLFVG